MSAVREWIPTRNEEAGDLDSVMDVLPKRDAALRAAFEGLRVVHDGLTRDQLFALAATDLFVEKAQRVLTRRYHRLLAMGIIASIVTFGVLAFAVTVAFVQLRDPIDDNVLTSKYALVLRVFQATALAAFILVAVKLLISFSRSFFHEAITLVERRHALRFGRLYVYLRRGEVADSMLEEAFQWNKDARTSFLDIRPEAVAETLLHKTLDVLGGLPPETIDAMRRTTHRSRWRRLKSIGSP